MLLIIQSISTPVNLIACLLQNLEIPEGIAYISSMSPISKDHIYTILFERIVNGIYPRDTHLREANLADEFGVSRTPIREVLMQLSQDGIVALTPNRGATVSPLTADDVEEMYAIRKQLEILALEFALPHMSLEPLRDLKCRLTALKGIEDAEEAMRIDREIHQYLLEASKKKRLITIVNQLLRPMESFRSIGFQEKAIFDRVNSEHVELIDTITKRDIKNAREVLAEHLENSKQATIGFLFQRTN